MEYFDFLIAGVFSAIVWPEIFFSGVSPALAFPFSIAAFGVTGLSRPVAAFLFGNFGDKVGRKTALLWTLGAMGVGTAAIALLPSYATIGFLAPILLIVFRLVQGFGIGGEWGPVSSWISEFAAKSKWRAFWTSPVSIAAALGGAFGSFSVAIASSSLPHVAFLDWGWRVIYLAGAVVLVFGIVIRYKVAESPLFTALRESRAIEKHPAIVALKVRWKTILYLPSFWVYTVIPLLIYPFTLAFLEAFKLPVAFVVFAAGVGSMVSALSMLLGGILGDVIGKRNVILTSSILTIVFIYPFYLLINTLVPSLILLGLIVIYTVPNLTFGVLPALYTESFPTKFRSSGAGLAAQIGNLITGGVLITAIYPIIIGVSGGIVKAWPYLIAAYAAVTAVALIGALFLKDTKLAELERSD